MLITKNLIAIPRVKKDRQSRILVGKEIKHNSYLIVRNP